MNEDMLNMSVRKFLKKVGVTSQREIEEAVRLAMISGRLKGTELLPAKVKPNAYLSGRPGSLKIRLQ
jgi:hypothetical protein